MAHCPMSASTVGRSGYLFGYRQSMDTDTTLAVVEQFDPNKLGEVFTAAAITVSINRSPH